jgi:serine/threonine-protein kinase
MVALAGLMPGIARAQPAADDVARADQAFTTGKKLLQQGNDAEACAQFAESKSLAPAVGVTLYLADCYQRIGKIASAWTEFRSAETLANERHDRRAALARSRALALAPALSSVTVSVSPDRDPTSLEITCDGHPIARDAWGTAVPLDPGDHVVVARSGGLHRTFDVHVDAKTPTATVEVDQLDGESPKVTPPAEAEATEATAPSSSASTASSTDDEAPQPPATGGDSGRLLLSLGLAGVGVAGVSVGTILGLMARSDRDASNAGPCDAADRCNQKGLSLRKDAINEAWGSTAAFAVGAVALGASVVVAFVVPHKPSGPVVVSAAPMANGAGALVRTSF